MTKIINWIVMSSADPEKVSMTIKGTLLTWVSMIIFVGQAFHFSISEGSLTVLIQNFSMLAGSLLMAVGLIRKIYYIFK